MEDENHGIFKKEKNQVIYKQILSDDDIEQLLKKVKSRYIEDNSLQTIVTGHRQHVELDLSKELRFIVDKLEVVLFDYFSDIEFYRYARYYVQLYGGIKSHKDRNRDGFSNYTLLIYLTDDFYDGKLSIKTERS